jgi:hypothetical protein
MTTSLRSIDSSTSAIDVSGVEAIRFTGAGFDAGIKTISATVAANALTISSPAIALQFRSATLSSGTVVNVSGSPANLVVPSGATLGTINAVQSELVVLALNNAGTIELAVVNIAGGNDLSEMGVISTTAISGSSNSANVIYSNSARTNVAYRVVGLVRSTQTTAGTWAAAPTLVQGAGGNALDAMSSLGYGQTWQNVTGSRVLGTTYYNTTGRPIQVIVGGTTSNGSLVLTVAGVALPYTWATTTSVPVMSASAVVPPGASYSCAANGTVTMDRWSELR